jgi:hypothetical protein
MESTTKEMAPLDDCDMSMHVFSTPRDLAKAIGNWLKSPRADDLLTQLPRYVPAIRSRLPNQDVPDSALVTLCETLYMASVATEEGQFVRIELVYIDPDQVEEKADASWHVFAFGERLPFTLPNLIKLAPASDPRNSSTAVFHDSDGTVFLWGLIDQRDPAYKVLRREVSSRTHETCGIFEASIEGPANIFVHSGHELIGELNIGSLRTAANYIDIFRSGPVLEICETGIRSIAQRLSAQVGDNCQDEIVSSTRHGFISALCTILLRLQSFRHGGALLIRRPQDDHLKIRYPMEYNRLTKTLEQSSLQRAQQLSEINGPDPSHTNGGFNLLGSEEILDSAIWFVAVLSRVDGLVVMDPELGVEGFGVIIRCQTIPPRDSVFRSYQADVCEDALEPLDYDHLGTRHQSMMRYCYEHPGTVGFVVSEDGDARAMSLVDARLIVWENIKLLNVC